MTSAMPSGYTPAENGPLPTCDFAGAARREPRTPEIAIHVWLPGIVGPASRLLCFQRSQIDRFRRCALLGWRHGEAVIVETAFTVPHSRNAE